MQIHWPDLYFVLFYYIYTIVLLYHKNNLTNRCIQYLCHNIFGTETLIHHKKAACANIDIVKVLSFEFFTLKILYMDNEWLGLLEIFIWHTLKGTFSAFINTFCRKWTADVEATKLLIYFHWKSWNIYNMKCLTLGFETEYIIYSHIASPATRLTSSYLLSVFTLFLACIADGAWSRSSAFKYQSLTPIRAI